MKNNMKNPMKNIKKNPKKNPKKNRFHRALLSSRRCGIALLLTLGLLCTSCGGREAVPAPELIPPVSSTDSSRPVERRDIGEVEILQGTVVPESYPVFSEKTFYIYELKVNPGDLVKEGDVIATGDTRYVDQQIRSLTKQLDVLKLEKSTAETVSRKTEEKLGYQKKAAEEVGYAEEAAAYDKEIKIEQENRRYNMAMVDASISSMNKELNKLKDEKAKLTFTAPHDGQVTYLVDISSTNMVMANSNIAVVSDFDDLYIEAEENTKSYAFAKYEEKYIVTDGRKIPVEEYNYTSAEMSYADNMGSYPAVRFRANGVTMEPGATIPIYFTKKSCTDVLAIGMDSVFQEGDIYYCYVLSGDGQRERREITLGSRDSLYTEVVTGLSEGEAVFYDNKSVIPANYKDYKVQTRDYVEENYSEYVSELLTDHEIYVADVTGSVEELYVSSGDEVEKGQEMLRLTIPTTRGELAEQKNLVSEAEKQYTDTIKGFNEQEKALRDAITEAGKSGTGTVTPYRVEPRKSASGKPAEIAGATGTDEGQTPSEDGNDEGQGTDDDGTTSGEGTGEDAGNTDNSEADHDDETTTETGDDDRDEAGDDGEDGGEDETDGDGDAEDEEPDTDALRDSKYLKERLSADLEILLAQRKLYEARYAQQKEQLKEELNRLSGFGTNGSLVIKAEEDGKLGQNLPAAKTSIFQGQYLFTINRSGEKLLRISMPKKRGQDVPEAAKAGQRITFKVKDGDQEKILMGTCVAENGDQGRVYLFTRDGKVHLTTSTPYSAGQAEQFFVRMDDDSFFGGETLPSAVASFQSVVIHGGITVPAKAVYTEKDSMTQKTSVFVWKVTEDGLAKQEVTCFQNSQFSDTRLILSGLNAGDVIAVE